MTLDQKILLWNAIGTWVAGIATLAAVLVSLWLATHSNKIRLQIKLGMMVSYIGDGSPGQNFVGFTVSNVSERNVTISSICWQVGKKDKKRHAYQPITDGQIPRQISAGDSALFTISLTKKPHWPKEFANGFVEDFSDDNIKTLKGVVVTSIGQRFEITPDISVIKTLTEAFSK